MYLAMELLGPTLNDITQLPQINGLDISSVVKIGIYGLDALAVLHNTGFSHGSINSDKFAIGYTKDLIGNLYLFGFGKSMKFDNL
ncbi:MAG: hypothetical protein EZS28_054442, partial [Streblomastix strix]